MLKVLLKKQMAEIFRAYFYDQKKNRARSKGGVAAMFILYIFLLGGLLGGMFAMLSYSICAAMTDAGMAWMYFVIFGLISLVLGVFGSVFSTYSSLYLARDNDLLLSMPIRVRDLIVSRLLGVYLMGTMYSLTALIPSVVVYLLVARPGGGAVAGSLIFILIVTSLVLVLSAALGWVVAKISTKLKNKSFVTVLISLVFFAGYYFLYFKATDYIQLLAANAAVYGEKLRGSAYGLYLFGRIGEGDPVAIAVFAAAAAVLLVLMWQVLSRSFIKIATATGGEKKKRYREKAAKTASPAGALLRRELSRFTSSANYMLNCGFGVLFIPAGGIALLLKGKDLAKLISLYFGMDESLLPVLVCAALCLLASMNDSAAPSVSLEGKTIWLSQSLPVKPWQVLQAKLRVQLIITLIPMAVSLVLAAIALHTAPLTMLLVSAVCLCDCVLNALFCLFLGVKMPNLTWTNEITPVKQSGSVLIALFFGWAVPPVIFGAYFLLGAALGVELYLGLVLAVIVFFSLLLYRWLRTKGAAQFAAL